MTIKDLSSYYYLQQEIARYDERITRLREERETMRGPRYDSIGAGRGGTPENKIEALTAEIVDLEDLLALNRKKRTKELDRLERYISSVKDPVARTVIDLRFRELLSWDGVAARMAKTGDARTADCWKKILYRYLEKHPE